MPRRVAKVCFGKLPTNGVRANARNASMDVGPFSRSALVGMPHLHDQFRLLGGGCKVNFQIFPLLG